MLPHDWKSAWSTFSALHADVAEHGERAASFLVSFFLPFLVGVVVSILILPPALVDVSRDKETIVSLASGVLAFTGILVGFLVTLILFTGRLSYPKKTGIEELQFYVDRTRYMLYSQIVTLFSAIITTALVLIWSVLVAGNFNISSILIMGHCASGFFSVCLIRSILLPLQIYEMHVSWMNALMAARRDEIEKEYSSPDDGRDHQE